MENPGVVGAGEGVDPNRDVVGAGAGVDPNKDVDAAGVEALLPLLNTFTVFGPQVTIFLYFQ